MSRIYLSVPHMGGDEQGFVAEAFASNWLSSVGPNLDAFEQEFSALVGLPCVALSSGTAAIHLGLRLLEVATGDEVICPSCTFVASVNPIAYQGARPIFIDSETKSWNMDPNLLEAALRKPRARRPKAIVLVHLFGQSADLDAIVGLSERYGVPILEDAAEALGTTHGERPVGTRAPVSAFSFNGNKMITTTGGGMLVAHQRAWVEKARFWSTQARDPGVGYHHSEQGYNYRMSNVLAGIGRGQLRVLPERVAARRAVAFRYRDAFAELAGVELMPQADWGLHTNWLSCFLIDEARLGVSRDRLIEVLALRDIEARPVWKALHLQPLFAGAERHGGQVAERLWHQGICLPSSSSLTADEQQRVIDAVLETVSEGRLRSAAREHVNG